MIKISSISLQEKDKTKCNIFVKDEYFCSLSLECVVKYTIKEGAEFDEIVFNDIKLEDEIQLALRKAKNYIAKSLKTKMQVISYLKGKGFNGKVIFEVVEKMLEYGYIDDVAYAKAFLESNVTLGKRLADYKLMQKGVKKQDIESARELIEYNSLEACIKLADKRLRNKEITKRKNGSNISSESTKITIQRTSFV